MPKKRTRAQARAIVEQFHRSGLTQRAFAEQLDLSKNTLASWILRERREPAATGTLVPITAPDFGEGFGFELEVDGLLLRIPRDVTTDEWRTLREAWTS